MQGRRLGRLGGQIQEEVSEIIARKLKDPRVGFVTITGAKVSADLSYASIYVSVMGSQAEIDKTLAGLEGAKSFIRSELASRLHIKHIPELRFHLDDSIAKGARIDSILKHLKEDKHDPGSPEHS
ncbi:MAG TPA: 30S ribosome-binding factor RbfA [bacterium]|nr:30S ribosome-binding factor RbfA [bacterium]